MLLTGETVYEKVASLCSRFNAEQMAATGSAYPSLGLVVGATDLGALRAVRELSPESWILCPGVGAQGGDADVLNTIMHCNTAIYPNCSTVGGVRRGIAG